MNALLHWSTLRMESCTNGRTYHRARPAPRLRRLVSRLGMVAIALVVVTLIFIGEQWLFVDAAGTGIELGVAVRAADAGSD